VSSRGSSRARKPTWLSTNQINSFCPEVPWPEVQEGNNISSCIFWPPCPHKFDSLELKTQRATFQRLKHTTMVVYKRKAALRKPMHMRELNVNDKGKRNQITYIKRTAQNAHTLYDSIRLNDILQDTSSIHEINNRQRQIVNLRGFELRCFVNNRTRKADGLTAHTQVSNIIMRCAVVHPRNNTSVLSSNFLRGYTNLRTAGVTGGQATVDLIHSPINKDAYDVLYEKKFVLAPSTTDAATPADREICSQSGKSFKIWKTYVPINRQMRYKTNAADSQEQPIYFVYWGTLGMKSAGTNANRDNERYDIEVDCIQYFNEPSGQV